MGERGDDVILCECGYGGFYDSFEWVSCRLVVCPECGLTFKPKHSFVDILRYYFADAEECEG